MLNDCTGIMINYQKLWLKKIRKHCTFRLSLIGVGTFIRNVCINSIHSDCFKDSTTWHYNLKYFLITQKICLLAIFNEYSWWRIYRFVKIKKANLWPCFFFPFCMQLINFNLTVCNSFLKQLVSSYFVR